MAEEVDLGKRAYNCVFKFLWQMISLYRYRQENYAFKDSGSG